MVVINRHTQQWNDIHGVFSPDAQVTWTETTFVCISEGPVFTLPVCMLVQHYGMMVISTHPAFPSAPAVSAKCINLNKAVTSKWQ